MEFYTAKDLRIVPKDIWESLTKDGEVVITNNGRPKALMIDICDGNLEETSKAIKQAKAMIAVNNIRNRNKLRETPSDDEINDEIKEIRTRYVKC